MNLLLLILALIDPLLPPVVEVPDRVQTYTLTWINQSIGGDFQCTTDWLTKTWTNSFSLWTNGEDLCVGQTYSWPASNRLMLWRVHNNSNLFSINLGMVATQYFTVTTNAPFLKIASPPPPPVTNFILTIYGSTNLISWYVLTNLYVPNSKPFEFLKVGMPR